MNLVVDIGNSRTKLGFFKNDELLESKTFTHPQVCDIELELRRNPKITNCIISATANIDIGIEKLLYSNFPCLIKLSGNTPLPFYNGYLSKTTQGPDRIAAIAGGITLYPCKPILIIDAGTALTFDFISEENQYLGGNISPGLSMRFKALHEYTAKLPLLDKTSKDSFLGNETNQAIISGVQNGILFEIDHYIDILTTKYPNLTTIMTGGDADFLANKLKRTIFVNFNLVLIGLNRILSHNAQL